MKPRIGLIGVGEISGWHVRALRHVGFEISSVASRPGSTRIQAFAKDYNIPRLYYSFNDLLSDTHNWDGLVIATRTEGTMDLLRKFAGIGKPILVEKPVSHSSQELENSIPYLKDNILVAYNRRYYKTVQYAKSFVDQRLQVQALMVLPESINLSQIKDRQNYLYPFYDNSCHGIDMLRYIFGKLSLANVNHIRNEFGMIAGYSAILLGERGDIIQLLGSWGSPTNFSLSVSHMEKRLELKPFESAILYEGMQVIPPSDEYPVRRYIPKEICRINLESIDYKEKPGFVQQAREFLSMFNGQEIKVGATIIDAFENIKLSEKLVQI